MKKWSLFLMLSCVAMAFTFQSCDESEGYSIGDVTAPQWETVRVTGDSFYLNSDIWGTLFPITGNLFSYQAVDGQIVITQFNPLYDDFYGYDHAVQIWRICYVLPKGIAMV